MTITEMLPRINRATEQDTEAEPGKLDQIKDKLDRIETFQRDQIGRLLNATESAVKAYKTAPGPVSRVDLRPTPRRPARDGELCSCGHPAVKVLLFDDLGPVPSCAGNRTHRSAACPSWCVDEHSTSFDQLHNGETVEVELDHHVEQEFMQEEWKTFRLPLLVGLTKEPNSKPAYVEIVGVDDKLAGKLTPYEADQLADILRDLAATLRAEESTTRG